jgi:hypothetical protein
MSGLAGILRALRHRRAPVNVGAAHDAHVRATVSALRRDVAALGDAAAALHQQTASLQQQIDRLIAIRTAEASAPAQLDRLERVLDRDRIEAHVRRAIAAAAVVDKPVAHAVVDALLPEDVYATALAAVPAALFFDGTGNRSRELKLPPELPPLTAVVAWTFLTDVINEVVPALLADRFQAPLISRLLELYPSAPDIESGVTLAAGPARIVHRRPGSSAPAARLRPWHVLAMTFDLARPDDDAEYGSVLAIGRNDIPFRANTALVVIDPGSAHGYAPIPENVSAGVERYTYEVRFGPDQASRRRLE